jgi:GGDEF domain-containing protein
MSTAPGRAKQLADSARSDEQLVRDCRKGKGDVFGHDAGDVVPQSIADLFRSFFRNTDICCR